MTHNYMTIKYRRNIEYVEDMPQKEYIITYSSCKSDNN